MSDLTIEVKNDAMLGRLEERNLHLQLIEKDKEIERLNEELEFEKLKNKEVREYIKNNSSGDLKVTFGIAILEILDKEKENEF